MTDVQQLLAEYVEQGSEPAFRELVARYLNFVYSTALRLVNGNTQLAEDVAQVVFIDLARKARKFSPGVMLGGWLHQHTFYVATKAVRAEQRRQSRENEASQMNALHDDSEGNWRQIAPLLDEAITQLGAEERAAILLRFFEQHDFRSIGVALGSSEDAARMRVNRALEKLHVILKRRGVTLSAAALGTVLTTEAVSAAPAGLAAGIAAAALAGVPAGSATLATTIKILSMTKLQTGIITVLTAVAVGLPLAVQHHARVQLREKDDALRQQNEQIAQLTAAAQQLSNQLAQAKSAHGLSQSQLNELLRLRSQTGDLKKQLAEAARLQKSQPAPPAPANDASTNRDDQQKQIALRKMDSAKHWLLAFFLYASDNHEGFPRDFNQATSYISQDNNLSQDVKDEILRATNQFEMVYQGPINAITNAAETILLRETEATPAGDGWVKTYGFADGHVEIHKFADNNFQDWEAQRMIAPPKQ